MGQQTEENDEKVVVEHGWAKVQLIKAPCSQLRIDYTFTMSDNKGR